MNLRDQVSKESNNWVAYYQADIQRVLDARGDMDRLAIILEPYGFPTPVMTYDDMDVTFETMEEARDFCSKLIQETEIESFQRISKSTRTALIWGWLTSIGKATLTVWPADPSPDCTVVESTLTYKSYSCQKVEKAE